MSNSLNASAYQAPEDNDQNNSAAPSKEKESKRELRRAP